MKFQSSILTAVVAASLLSACSDGKSRSALDSNSINVAAIKADATLTPAEKADQLASASERLVTPTSFMYADLIASEALTADPTNARAKFWKAVLGPAMATKGIVGRIEPLMKKSPRRYAEYRQMVADMKQSPETEVTSFLLHGPKDIKSERDVQEFVATFTARLNDARETLKSLKDEELVVRINQDQLKEKAMDRALSACRVKMVEPGVFQTQNCDLTNAYEVRLNKADIEILQQSIAGLQVYLTWLNAYDLSGALSLVGSKEEDPEKAFTRLARNPQFGKLRDGKSFGVMPAIAQDAITAVRYAQSIQSELCPSDESEIARPGQLFEGSLCVETGDEFESSLRLIETIVQGTQVVVPVEIGDQSVAALVDFKAFISHPVSDLRDLAPTFDACGETVAIGNGTFGGLFPNGDLNVLLATSAKAKHPYGCSSGY